MGHKVSTKPNPISHSRKSKIYRIETQEIPCRFSSKHQSEKSNDSSRVSAHFMSQDTLQSNRKRETLDARITPFCFTLLDSRDLKQGRRRRERERQKTISIMSKNNGSASPARAFCIFVHFVAVLSKTTT